ncbi:RedY protein [Streptomyces griseoaurantiacus]|uniref:RedY protein n=1 Tax=Streptomyces griseoaurantiacus TaxID=68213 RepID=A0A7W2DR49_9ACTN|nr:RedY protein [Streptomyces griseoaurantiacus]MBA5221207.1 RedY protein [Streptomyces griseoaurantiacus]
MTVLIHRIQLLDSVEPERFERWVREVDYAACPELPSVLAFGVHRVDATPDTGAGGRPYPAHYFEIIEVSSPEDFARDMDSARFRRLEADFGRMAKVVEEVAGERIGEGYRAHGDRA